MLGQRLSFVEKEGCNCQFDDKDEGSSTGEKSQYQHEGAKYFCKDSQYQGPAVADMEGIEEAVLVFTKVQHFVEAVVNADEQTESEAQQEQGEVEGRLRILCREEFFHVRLEFRALRYVFAPYGSSEISP